MTHHPAKCTGRKDKSAVPFGRHVIPDSLILHLVGLPKATLWDIELAVIREVMFQELGNRQWTCDRLKVSRNKIRHILAYANMHEMDFPSGIGGGAINMRRRNWRGIDKSRIGDDDRSYFFHHGLYYRSVDASEPAGDESAYRRAYDSSWIARQKLSSTVGNDQSYKGAIKMTENISEIKKLVDVMSNGATALLEVDYDLLMKQLADLDGKEKTEIITLIGEKGINLLQKILTTRMLLKLVTRIIV